MHLDLWCTTTRPALHTQHSRVTSCAIHLHGHLEVLLCGRGHGGHCIIDSTEGCHQLLRPLPVRDARLHSARTAQGSSGARGTEHRILDLLNTVSHTYPGPCNTYAHTHARDCVHTYARTHPHTCTRTHTRTPLTASWPPPPAPRCRCAQPARGV